MLATSVPRCNGSRRSTDPTASSAALVPTGVNGCTRRLDPDDCKSAFSSGTNRGDTNLGSSCLDWSYRLRHRYRRALYEFEAIAEEHRRRGDGGSRLLAVGSGDGGHYGSKLRAGLWYQERRDRCDPDR